MSEVGVKGQILEQKILHDISVYKGFRSSSQELGADTNYVSLRILQCQNLLLLIGGAFAFQLRFSGSTLRSFATNSVWLLFMCVHVMQADTVAGGHWALF